ncbi:hypothetical protein FHT87_004090 [Rhizobium sp. BK316]|uniref:hypothetical protein n=1 Tax=Rhizobium sp. BK316 TaxID=2587053 RepID=UPI0016178451|nr:hypothetical protein [Rhizobium sp. BK316]MBB3410158.1 hypothetical protein [Rhizobium sp. BK316]
MSAAKAPPVMKQIPMQARVRMTEDFIISPANAQRAMKAESRPNSLDHDRGLRFFQIFSTANIFGCRRHFVTVA